MVLGYWTSVVDRWWFCEYVCIAQELSDHKIKRFRFLMSLCESLFQLWVCNSFILFYNFIVCNGSKVQFFIKRAKVTLNRDTVVGVENKRSATKHTGVLHHSLS